MYNYTRDFIHLNTLNKYKYDIKCNINDFYFMIVMSSITLCPVSLFVTVAGSTQGCVLFREDHH